MGGDIVDVIVDLVDDAGKVNGDVDSEVDASNLRKSWDRDVAFGVASLDWGCEDSGGGSECGGEEAEEAHVER